MASSTFTAILTINAGVFKLTSTNISCIVLLSASCLAGYYLDGSRIEVSWAKPADKNESLRSAQQRAAAAAVVAAGFASHSSTSPSTNPGLSLDHASLLNLLKPSGTLGGGSGGSTQDAISRSLTLQQQQHQLLLNAFMNSTTPKNAFEGGGDVAGCGDSMSSLRSIITQNQSECRIREALAISRILNESRSSGAFQTSQAPSNLMLMRKLQQHQPGLCDFNGIHQ